MSLTGFIASRLAQAREARGLTMTSLAGLADIAKQSISLYESGKQNPRQEAVAKLAAALNFPEAFFFKPTKGNENSPIFFRSLSSLTKSSRLQATTWVEWIEEIIDLLSCDLDFPKANIPSHSEKSMLAQMSDEDIDKIAYDCRAAMGLGWGPIPDMSRLLESVGCIIVRMDINIHAEDGFSKWVRNGETPIVVLSTDKASACRDRFSQAHELGHLVMHRNVVPSNLNLKTIESQANRFASAFLMPDKGYVKDFAYPSLDTFKALKAKWKTSIASQIMRCAQLKIIDDMTKRRFFMHISRRGWNTMEPLDNTIKKEEALLLQKAISMLIDEKRYTKDDLVSAIGLHFHDIEGVLGLPRNFLSDSADNTVPVVLKNILPFPTKPLRD